MTRRFTAITLVAPLLAIAPACADDGAGLDEVGETDNGDDADTDTSGTTGGDSADDTGDGTTTGTPGDNPSCDYTSPFTTMEECRDYLGSAWTETEAAADCDGVSGDLDPDQGCSSEGILGRCIVDAGTEWEQHTVIYGDDAADCDLQATGCETFAGGTWEPAEICEGSGTGGTGGDEDVFIQPYLECLDPIEGEPAGMGPDGQVCTWQAISASTEQNRSFFDYGDCEVVYSQRPYYSVPPNALVDEPDPRLDDPEYAAELDWVRSQIEASACVCCHSDQAPNGPANWYVEAPNNWINSFYDSGLALGAGWVDSTSFGAYPPEDNNGFDRINSGIPSTDPERMVAFFVNELAHRGKSEADFADTPAFGGPLYSQLVYEPSACENGEGVMADGSVIWTGGPARYVYVLASGSANPTVPPNLDLPDGTLWRIDVPWDGGEPVTSGEVEYGTLPAGLTQTFPTEGGPQGLVPGQEYYLYVTKDVGIPITRCLFTY